MVFWTNRGCQEMNENEKELENLNLKDLEGVAGGVDAGKFKKLYLS